MSDKYCVSCFNCRAHSPFRNTLDEGEDAAGEAGWVMGLSTICDGAQIACPECKPFLFDTFPVRSIASTFGKKPKPHGASHE